MAQPKKTRATKTRKKATRRVATRTLSGRELERVRGGVSENQLPVPVLKYETVQRPTERLLGP